MSYNNQVYSFSTKWLAKFSDQNINYLNLVDHYMADDCKALEFEMDCGHAFEKLYGDAANDTEKLNTIIDNVNDIKLLGSAIYSRWRYFNHWAYDGKEILEEKNRSWFITALERLSVLTGGNNLLFKGTPKRIHIVSNVLCFGPCPKPGKIFEQNLSVNSSGRVTCSEYAFGDENYKLKKVQTKKSKISKEAVQNILNKVAIYFSNKQYEEFVTDIGYFEIKITNTDGKVFEFNGSLCGLFETDGINISDLIRDTLKMPNLFVFDGNGKSDIINKIVVDYKRVSKIEQKVSEYKERLSIDRKTESITFIRNIKEGCKVTRKYEIKGAVANLLDVFDADELFSYIRGNSDEVVDTPNESKNYKITMSYEKNPRKVITGTFDKYGLPDDFGEFVTMLNFTLRRYNVFEMIDFSIFDRKKRLKSDLIFCSVKFSEGEKNYYYLTADDEINVGDFVVVPVGIDNHEEVVEVMKIEYFNDKNAPFPISKIKHIIRKSSDGQHDLSISDSIEDQSLC